MAVLMHQFEVTTSGVKSRALPKRIELANVASMEGNELPSGPPFFAP